MDPDARARQARLELDTLRVDIQQWLDRRRIDDTSKQYQTQYDTLKDRLLIPLNRLQENFATPASAAIPIPGVAPPTPGALYDRYALIETRTAWLRRVFEFFQRRFDQRDNDMLRPVLKAADEVVWSCYHQVFDSLARLKGAHHSGPAPLPFVDSYYSPAAYPVEVVPNDLRDPDVGGEFIRQNLNRSLIAVTRVTRSCALSPWWLVLLGHEVGHHIQYDLLPDKALVDGYKGLVQQTVADQGASADEQELWGAWSKEIFADIVSAHLMGQWALWALIEFEFHEAATMLQRSDNYPAPLARLALLTETVRSLQLNWREGLRGLDLDALSAGDAGVERDRSFITAVVSASLQPLPGLDLTLAQLCDFRREDFLPGGEVENWRSAFRDGTPRAVTQNLRDARLMAAGALAAWSDLLSREAAPPDETRVETAEEIQSRLQRRRTWVKGMLDNIALSAVSGTRATSEVAADTSGGGDALADWLLSEAARQEFGPA